MELGFKVQRMNLFNDLLSLYKKSRGSNTPTEDYCTECLAGILRSNTELLNEFAETVLKIDNSGKINVFTQRSYRTIDGDLGIVDMVFESNSALCLLEMKVESGEGAGQLEKYQQILNERPQNGRKMYLRYCSLYIDNKEGYSSFKQFRWADIADFLKDYTIENQLIQEFYQFLKENKMTGNERFNHEDLIGLKVYGDIASKVHEVFSVIEDELKTFGTISGGINSSNRLAIFCSGVIGEKWSEVLVSYDFKGIRYKDEPVLAVQLFVHRKNSVYKQFVEVATEYYQDKKFESKDIFSTNEHGGHIRFEKPSAMFFNEEEQLQEMARWVENKFGEVLSFRNATNQLDWNFESNEMIK